MPRHRLSTGRGLPAAAGVLLVILMPALAQAQAYPRIAPKQPAIAPPPVVTAPASSPPAAPASNAVILPALKGVVFVPGRAAVRPAGLPAGSAGGSGIGTAGLPLLRAAGFTRQVTPFIGRPLTLADLQAIARIASTWYRSHGRPFVVVTVPPQNIGSGVVQVVVTEYRVGTVKAAGNRWFSSALLERESGLRQGQTLTLAGVQADLDWLNANPFRRVDTIFGPGATPGTTDVVLQTQDRLPLHVYASFDNQGVPSLGRGEWSVGGTWGNLGGLDQIMSYQFTHSLSGRYTAHSLNWTIPLRWRDQLLVFGSYAQERPDVSAPFDETGHSGEASLRYVHDLPSLSLGDGIGLSEDLQLGYDFKTTDNNLEFGGEQVFATQADIDQFPLIYDATLTDRYGQTAIQEQLVLSPGGITGDNDDQAFETLVPGASASYAYDTVGLTRTTFLPWGFSWTTRVLGQVANHNLLYSEQLGLGGMGSVRGYFTDTALGSQGVLVSNEVRGPAFSLGDLMHLNAPVRDVEQLGLFWDYGHTSQVSPIPDAVNEADLSSLGADLDASLNRYVVLAFDVGWQLRDAPDTDKRGAFSDITLTVGY